MKKEKFKQIATVAIMLVFLIMCFVVGMVIGRFIDSTMPRFVSYLLAMLGFVAAFFIHVAMHELGHYLAFVLQKVPVSLFNINFFVLMKKRGKVKFIFNKNAVTGMGGVVIPDPDMVSNEDELKILQKKFARAIITAPIVTIFLAVIGAAVIIPIVFLNINIDIFTAAMLMSLVIVGFLLSVSSTIKNDVVVGDFAAYKLFKDSEFFTAIQLYQDYTFSEDKSKRKECDYLRNVIDKSLAENFINNTFPEYSISAADCMLYEYLIGLRDSIPDGAMLYVDKYRLNLTQLLKDAKCEPKVVFYYHILYLIAMSEPEKAVNIFDRNRSLLPVTPIYSYYSLQAQHFLGLNNNTSVLTNKACIKTSSAYTLFRLFEVYYSDELRLFKIFDELKNSREKLREADSLSNDNVMLQQNEKELDSLNEETIKQIGTDKIIDDNDHSNIEK